MKFDIKEDKLTEFLLGVGMFIAGIILLTKNIYVSTPMFNHGIRIGGIYVRTPVQSAFSPGLKSCGRKS